jgi:hypothetical protein
MSGQSPSISWGKVGSDLLFGVAAVGCFLRVRKGALSSAYLTQRMSPLAAGILKFERRRGIDSSLYYIQRTVLYLVLAATASAASQLYSSNAMGVAARGCLLGCCFGTIGLGIIAGSVGGICWWGLEGELRDYL